MSCVGAQMLPSTTTWPSVEEATGESLDGLFYDPVILPLDEHLKAIDAASVPLLEPIEGELRRPHRQLLP